MKKTILSVIPICILMVSLCACDKDEKQDNVESSGNGIAVVNETASEPIQEGQSDSQSSGPVLEIIVRGDKIADFIFDSTTAQGMDNLTAVTVQFTDDYLIGLNDFDGTGDFQCDMWKVDGNNRSIMDNAGATFSFDGSKVVLTSDMSSVDDFSFPNVSGDCKLHYEYKDQGGPELTLSWADVAREELSPVADDMGDDTDNAGGAAAKELLDSLCGEYKEKQGDTLELAKSGDGYVFKNMKLKTRDSQYNDGMDSSSIFGADDVEVLDDHNVRVSFVTQMMADEGTAELNGDGFIRLSLKGPNMPDYLNYEFIKQ